MSVLCTTDGSKSRSAQRAVRRARSVPPTQPPQGESPRSQPGRDPFDVIARSGGCRVDRGRERSPRGLLPQRTSPQNRSRQRLLPASSWEGCRGPSPPPPTARKCLSWRHFRDIGASTNGVAAPAQRIAISVRYPCHRRGAEPPRREPRESADKSSNLRGARCRTDRFVTSWQLPSIFRRVILSDGFDVTCFPAYAAAVARGAADRDVH